MTAYEGILVLKFLSVMGFTGGTIAALLGADSTARKLAAHRVASPCLLATWLSGSALLLLKGIPLFELWVVGAVLLSLFANAMLTLSVAQARRTRAAFLGSILPVAFIVVLMVVKPTWAQVWR
jgi:hypothetical protein